MKYLVPVLLVLIIAVAACSKGDSSSNDRSSTSSGEGVVADTVSVPLNNCVTRKYNGDTTITYCFESVNDSRCPTGGICAWAGEADTKLSITINQLTHQVELYTPKYTPLRANDTTIARFNFKLLNVTPHPSLPLPNFNYKVILKVVRL